MIEYEVKQSHYETETDNGLTIFRNQAPVTVEVTCESVFEACQVVTALEEINQKLERINL